MLQSCPNEDTVTLVKNYVATYQQHVRHQYCSELWPSLDKIALLALDSTVDQDDTNTVVACLKWTGVDQWEKNLEHNTVAAENASECIHSLADDLPKFGVQLHVVWLRDQQWPLVKDNLELFGALKRLTCWHNAHTQLVSSESSPRDEEMYSWASVLCAEVTPLECFKQNCDIPAWKGEIRIYPNEGEEATVLPGVTFTEHQPLFPKIRWKALDTDQENIDEKIYNQHMDFIAMVDVRDIPPFYVTDTIFEVCVKCQGNRAKKSKKFLDLLMDQPQAGYLVRLSHGSSWKIVQKSRNFMSKPRDLFKKDDKNWTDMVMDNLNDVYKPQHNIQLCDDKGNDNFLLVKGRNSSGEDVITACKIRNPKEINGHAAQILAKIQDTTDSKDKTTIDVTLEPQLQSLPHYHCDTWQQLEEQIQQAQLHVLKQWREHIQSTTGDERLHADDVNKLLSGTRQQFMDKYRSQFGDIAVEREETEPLQFLEQQPEYVNPYIQLERIVLMYNSAQESRLARFQSTDSLGGLSPPSKGQVLKLDAGEFLKHFDQDGGAKKQKLSTIQVKKTRLNKFDSGEVRDSNWPDCSHYKYHDIYYNVGKTPEKREEKSTKLKSWLQSIETCSTCTIQQDQKPETIVVKQQLILSAKKGKAPARRSCLTPPDKISSGRKRTISIETPPKSASAKRKRTLTPAKLKATPTKKKRSGSTPTAGSGTTKRRPGPTPTAARVATPAGASGGTKENTIPGSSKAESRSQRHKRKLEEAVVCALDSQGVKKTEDKTLFKACFKRLYTLSYSFVKDLRGYTSLTEEMNNIAMMQAPTVVHFERRKLEKK